jgi:transposase
MATSMFRPNFPGAEALQQAADTATFLVGLDVHKKTVAICVVDPRRPDEPVFQRKRLPNADLLVTLQHFSGRKVVVCEAAYGWFAVREALAPLPDVTLVILDTRKTGSWIATSGIKNDKIDAQVLCHACLHGGIRSLAVHQPSRQAKECTKLLQCRQQWVRLRTKITNQLTAIERDYGVNPFTGEMPEHSLIVAALEAELRASLEETDRRIKNADRQMALLSKEDAVVARLQSIPGIGPITAFALRHKIESIERFADAAHLSSYFGLGMRERQSGDHLTKGKITKAGSTLIRTLLIQGAHVVRQRYPDHIPLYFPNLGRDERMSDWRHANKVVTAVARKNLTFAYHVWKNRTLFDIHRYREQRQQSRPAPVIAPSDPRGTGEALPSAPTNPVSLKTAAELEGGFALAQ